VRLANTISVAAVTVTVMVGASAFALTRLPGTPIPAHWAIDGRPDGYASPALVLFILPAVTAFVSLILAALPSILPAKGDLSRSRRPYVVVWQGILGLMLVLHLTFVASALGAPVDVLRIALVSAGVLLVLVGNVLPKTRFNYVMGVRTPWTLADERVWDRTHRFAGACLMLAGVCGVAGGLLLKGDMAVIAAFLGPVLAATLAAVVFSAVISPRGGHLGSPGDL
jgi:uncharacterized membrane protein